MKDLTKLEVPEDHIVCDLFMQQVVLACVTAADEVGLFSSLLQEPKTQEEIGVVLNANANAVGAVCKVLTANGFLSFDSEVYALTTATKAYFVRESTLYRGYQFKNSENSWHKKVLGTLNSGWSPIGADGKSFTAMWEEGTLSQSAADRFTGMMHTNISGPAIAVARSGAFSRCNHVIDVGGGSGIFLAALKQHFPEKNVTLLELPQVCESSKKILKNFVEIDSIGFFPCNMFLDQWPEFGDALFISNVLHDWPKEKAQVILKKAFDSLKPGGSIFVYECLLDEDRLSPSHTVAFDFLMFANHVAQQYTKNDLSNMLAGVGFTNSEKIFSFGYYSLLKADKV